MRSGSLPRLKGFDHTIAFLHDGYEFVSRRCDRLNSDAFLARLMLQKVVCARGEDAAQLFYEGGRFTRRGAMPPTTMRLLQDLGSVQQLDGAAHRHRKAMFVRLLMGADAEQQITELFRGEWRNAAKEWSSRPSIVLFDQANVILTKTICRWMQIPASKPYAELANEFSSMIENSGSAGFAVILALIRRRSTERYFERLVRSIREGTAIVATDSPLAYVVNYRDMDGSLLSERSAAVELINILRATVAIGRFVIFVAMALEQQPKWKEKLHSADDAAYEHFAEEVRRLYPFFPVIGGRAIESFEWRGHEFDCGDWFILDLYGTNNFRRLFPEPHQFNPARRLAWRTQGYDFIPQGGGDSRTDHRCPGEQITVGIMREACRLLVEDMQYELPEQDLTLSLHEIPARPRSGVVLSNIRLNI